MKPFSGCAEKVEAMGEPLFEELLEELASGDEESRRFAAEDLGDHGDPAAVPALCEALRDPAVAVREAAADALMAIGGEAVCRHMVPLLDDEDCVVRNLAVEVFERLRQMAIPVCLELYRSPSPDLRKIAVDTLGHIEETRESEGYALLHSALDDEHVNVAAAAIEALGRLGGSGVEAEIGRRVGRHPWLDAVIFFSLARLGTPAARKLLADVEPAGLEAQAAYAWQAACEIAGVAEAENEPEV